MKRVLFLIHDLGHGGAEKVLINLVNNMDRDKFDITVMALFGGGVNEQFLKPHIRYQTVFKKVFPGNSQIIKLLSPAQLHKWFIKEHYDIEISYLEGPSARIISGCPHPDTKLVSWIHVEQHTMQRLSYAFRNPKEATDCYNRFDRTVCVSQYVKNDFRSILNFQKELLVLYNTVESDKIRSASQDSLSGLADDGKLRLVVVGTLKPSKGYERLLNIINRLHNERYPIHLYILGEGPMRSEIELYIKNNSLDQVVTLLGYQTNPYKYVANCDLFVCASFAEGFSTAVTEALILGTPVCTVEVSGMTELLGDNNEYGIVTANDEEALYQGIKTLLEDRHLLEHYARQALVRGSYFNTEHTVAAVEQMLVECLEDVSWKK